jgi:hypothetical protein
VAATPSIKIVKNFNWRQNNTQFTNRYHFNGGTPSDATHWATLSNAIVTAEKAIYPPSVEIVSAIGYAAGSDVPVHTSSYTTAGTFTIPSTEKQAPGECVALLRWATAARSSKNHPVFLFNYYHGVIANYNSLDEEDLVSTGQKAAINTYAGSWITGFSDGTLTLVRAGPNGATATGAVAEQWITHRDFPR